MIKSFGVLFSLLLVVTACCDKSEETVKIGKQEWMTKDLRVRTYRNGDSLFFAKNLNEWKKASKDHTAACCYVYFDAKKGEKYGLLYNWYAVNDPRELAPKGFKIPSKKDWTELIDFAGGEAVAGDALKARDAWYPHNNAMGGKDRFGFRARASSRPGWNYNDSNSGRYGFWWTSDTSTRYRTGSECVMMFYMTKKCTVIPESRGEGAAVRCLKIN